MNLIETYKKVKPAIVAFVPKFYPVRKGQKMPEFPPIIGTGFILRDGLVATNDHIIQAIDDIPKPPNFPKGEWPINCLLLHMIPNKGMAQIHMDVIGVYRVDKFIHKKHYYGPKKPDVAFVHVKMKDLPSVKVQYKPEQIREGLEVATAGFPMGTDALTAPGYLHQTTPTLQKGIVSAVLPFECEAPHALMINVMTQGGASGSPVFTLDTGEVIGILYAGLNDIQNTGSELLSNDKEKIADHIHNYKSPANISYVVPAYIFQKMLKNIDKDKDFKLPTDTPSLKGLVEKSNIITQERGKSAGLIAWEGPKDTNKNKK